MSEFVTNVIKLIQDVKFFCYKCVRRITFFIHGAYTVCKLYVGWMACCVLRRWCVIIKK